MGSKVSEREEHLMRLLGAANDRIAILLAEKIEKRLEKRAATGEAYEG